MNVNPPAVESRLLIAFGKAAVKAQEIEALLQETVIIVEEIFSGFPAVELD